MNAESLISDNVILSGIVRPDAAASGSGEPNEGRVERYVFKGFTCWTSVCASRCHPHPAYLDSCLEGQESIARVTHLEYASEAIFCKVTDLQYLEVGWYGTQVHLMHNDIVDDDRRLW
jgi:hypothetical protein